MGPSTVVRVSLKDNDEAATTEPIRQTHKKVERKGSKGLGRTLLRNAKLWLADNRRRIKEDWERLDEAEKGPDKSTNLHLWSPDSESRKLSFPTTNSDDRIFEKFDRRPNRQNGQARGRGVGGGGGRRGNDDEDCGGYCRCKQPDGTKPGNRWGPDLHERERVQRENAILCSLIDIIFGAFGMLVILGCIPFWIGIGALICACKTEPDIPRALKCAKAGLCTLSLPLIAFLTLHIVAMVFFINGKSWVNKVAAG